jgi:hypothetical protein
MKFSNLYKNISIKKLNHFQAKLELLSFLKNEEYSKKRILF